MEKIEITELDTDNSLLYKHAGRNSIPTKFIVINKPKVKQIYSEEYIPSVTTMLEKYDYLNIVDILPVMIKNGKTLVDVQEYLNIHIKGNIINDLIYIYYTTIIFPMKQPILNSIQLLSDDFSITIECKTFTKNNINKRTSITDLVNLYNTLFYEKLDLDANLAVINELNTYNMYEEYKNFLPIEDGYITWSSEINELKERETKILNNINNTINMIKHTNTDDMTITPIVYSYFIRIGETKMKIGSNIFRAPNMEDGIDIFNNSITSYEVPYIQYNSNGKKYYKIYGDIENKDLPDYKNIIPSSSKTKDDNTFYMIVWSGIGNVKKSNKDTRMLISYDVLSNKIKIRSIVKEYTIGNTKITADKLIIQRIKNSLSLTITYTEELKVGSEFDIYGIDYDEESLAFLLMVDPIINSYLYIDERFTSYPFKQKLYFHLKSVVREEDKNKSTAWISFTNHKDVDHTKIIDGDNESALELGKRYKSYVRVKILRAQSRSIIKQLHYLLPRLLKYYNVKKPNFEKLLTSISPGMMSIFKADDTKIINDVVDTKLSKIKQMTKLAPDLIVKYYARSCQCNRQPIIIPATDIQAWQAKSIIISGIQYPRQVMPFPPNNPKWYFICPGDVWPFPGVRENKLENSTVYPFVPCCFKKDQITYSSNSRYNEIYRGIPRKKNIKNVEHEITTDKLLKKGRTGSLPTMIGNLLGLYSSNVIGNVIPVNRNKYIRNGVIHSHNSLIHCIYESFKVPEYLQLPTDQDREQYVINVRAMITIEIMKTPGLLKQELYDFSDAEIATQMNSSDIFFDPALYYRALEEYFNLNIYVFSAPSTTTGEFGKLEVPRHKQFHSRVSRKDRYTLIIFKHWGSESDKLIEPQCEYISSIDGTTNIKTNIFDTSIVSPNTSGQSSPEPPNMSEFLHEVFLETNKTIMWSLDSRNYRPIARSNIFSSFNILDILKPYLNNISGQYVDNYGKLRGIVIKLQDDYISVFVPPTQPERYIVHSKPLPENVKPQLTTLLSLFNIEPTMITKEDNIITGLWYPILDVEEGIYCPVLPNTEIDSLPEQLKYLASLPIGPTHKFFSKGVNRIKRFKKLTKMRNKILEITRWLFVLSGLSSKNFISKYIQVSNVDYTGIDSSEIYKLDSFPRIFPTQINLKDPNTGNYMINEITKDYIYEAITFETALEYMQSFSPSLNMIHDNKIVGYTKGLTNGLIQYIEDYEYSTDGMVVNNYDDVNDTQHYIYSDNGTVRPIPKEIPGLYNDENDFIHTKSTMIFVGESSLKSWLYSMIHLGVESSNIKKKLNISFSAHQYPYLYQSLDKHIYLIQNVKTGDLYRAINSAYSWYLNSKNPGFDSDKYDPAKEEGIPPYYVYSISTSGDLIPITDKTNGNTDYIKILSYSTKSIVGNIGAHQYAAILPML